MTRHFFCHSSLGHLLGAVIARPEQDDWRGKFWHILFICWGIFWWRKNVSVNVLKLRRFLILSHFVEDLVSITCRGQGSFLFGFSHQGCSINQSINHLFQCRQCWTNIHVLDLFDAPLTPCAHGSRDILHRRTLSPASFILYQVLEDICFWFWNKSKNGRKKSHH